MIRFLTLFFLLLISATAKAGDTSSLVTATFSNEGRTFVLIEKGISDGLGAPYMNAYAVDVETDNWLDGFPIRQSLNESEFRDFETENPDDYALREQEMMQAVLDDVMAKPGLIAALNNPVETSMRVSNTAWELSASAEQARFTLRNFIPSSGKAWGVDLTAKEFPAGEECYGFTDKMKGYRLVLTNEENGEIRVLNDDMRVPKSRACPLDYAIANVYSHPRSNVSISLAIVLWVSKVGFEGPDRRLMAVTAVLPAQ